MNKENTIELELTLALPSSLAQEAKAKGLLVPWLKSYVYIFGNLFNLDILSRTKRMYL